VLKLVQIDDVCTLGNRLFLKVSRSGAGRACGTLEGHHLSRLLFHFVFYRKGSGRQMNLCGGPDLPSSFWEEAAVDVLTQENQFHVLII
jgi:hypothetical protein